MSPGPTAGWASARGPGAEVVPAATVVLARDRPGGGLEVLMVRRSSRLAFAGGAWAFPGGRVEAADCPPGQPAGSLEAARRAAVRELAEETGLVVPAGSLVPFAHWTPPPGAPRRFATWFFVSACPVGGVEVDGSEIKDHAWIPPAEALARRDAGQVELVPPTWVSLFRLAQAPSAAAAVEEASRRRPEVFVTHLADHAGHLVALFPGDAGWSDSAPERPGPRHRLWMGPGPWRYERSVP
jgi:8-oxo-dGTP pyrophosphatase MutT (NUDIX family)